jgi:hypothetical protein
VAFTPEHRALIKQGLDAHFETVEHLKLDDGSLVPNQLNKIAYSWKNYIQLKLKPRDPKEAAKEDSWQWELENNNPLAVEIIHELIRASGAVKADGRSIDDSYEISETQYHLKSIPNQQLHSKALASVKLLNKHGQVFCDALPYWNDSPTKTDIELMNKCRAVVDLEADLGFLLIAGNTEKAQSVVLSLQGTYQDYCGLLGVYVYKLADSRMEPISKALQGGAPTNLGDSLKKICATAAGDKTQQWSILFQHDRSDLTLYQSEATTDAADLANAYMHSVAYFGEKVPKALKDYTDMFNVMSGALDSTLPR